jgi:hypothetical protein
MGLNLVRYWSGRVGNLSLVTNIGIKYPEIILEKAGLRSPTEKFTPTSLLFEVWLFCKAAPTSILPFWDISGRVLWNDSPILTEALLEMLFIFKVYMLMIVGM